MRASLRSVYAAFESVLPGTRGCLINASCSNMRCVTTRGVFEGGAQERELARENRDNAAKAAADRRPGTLLIFRPAPVLSRLR
jgi:hypothetical protein